MRKNQVVLKSEKTLSMYQKRQFLKYDHHFQGFIWTIPLCKTPLNPITK
jgi:hypothetical protein